MEGNQLLHTSIRLQGKIDDGIIRGQPPSFIPRPAAADPLLPLEAVHNPADGLIRIFNLEQGLHNIIDGPQPQSLLHIFKLVVAGQDDRMNVGMKLPQVTDQLKARHNRHGNIHEEQIDLFRLHQLERLLAVSGLPDHHDTEGRPIDQGHEALAYKTLVIHYCCSNHPVPPFACGE